MSNNTTKPDVKNLMDVDTLEFTKRMDLANLKSDVDKCWSDVDWFM